MNFNSRLDELVSQWEASDGKATPEELSGGDEQLCAALKARIRRLRNSDRLLGISPENAAPDIPGYRIIGWIGRGGMGEVWEAEQLGTKRKVALKLIRPTVQVSPRARARFEREVELASRLQHPNIARVYESGVHSGLFYYAMELVSGLPLDVYATRHALSHAQVLGLMLPICAAVQHAHNFGVIHRDLKPGNILVDATGQPHLLDFGLARQILVDDAAFVTLDEAPGTPAYMSPEQASGNSRLVGTGSDVYTLGVILFQLLLKRLPHDVEGSGISVMHRVAFEPPVRARDVDPNLPRELDAILLRALAYHPHERYPSPDALAGDLRAFLEGMPVHAMKGSRLYPLKKFVLRHRYKLTAGAMVALLLLSVAIVAYRNVARARDEAKTESQIAAAVNDYLLNRVLRAVDPEVAQGQVPTLRELLDRAEAEVDDAFSGQPIVEASVRSTLAGAYLNLHQHEIAERNLRRAYDLFVANLGPDHPKSLKAQAMLAFTLETEDMVREAERLQRDLLVKLRRIYGDEHPDTLMCVHRLGNLACVRRDGVEGERYLRQALEGRRKILGDDHVDTIWSLSDLAAALGMQRRHAEALPLLREAYAKRLRVQGDSHIDTLNAQLGLALTLSTITREDGEAVELLRRNIEGRRRVYGPEHPAITLPMRYLAMLLVSEHRYEEAAELARESLRLNRPVRGFPPYGAVLSLNTLIASLKGMNRMEEARTIAEPFRAHVSAMIEQKNIIWLRGWTDVLRSLEETEQADLLQQFIDRNLSGPAQ